MNKYLKEGLIRSEYIFYKSISNWWSVGFTKLMTDYEILTNSQTRKQRRMSKKLMIVQKQNKY